MSAAAEAALGFHPASRLYRFVVLFFVALLLYGSYFAYDSIGALTPLIIDGLGIGREHIGMLYSFYSWPNVVMVFIGGLLTDRYGTRKMSMIFSGLIVLGAIVVAAAPMLASGMTAFWWMLAGRTIFGIGSESGVTDFSPPGAGAALISSSSCLHSLLSFSSFAVSICSDAN